MFDTEAPADRCPYPRPFPPGFDECSTYQAKVELASDTMGRPLKPIATCAFLEVVTRPGPVYARCGIGDFKARRRWAMNNHGPVVEAVNRLRAESTVALMEPFVEFHRLVTNHLRARGPRQAMEVEAYEALAQLLAVASTFAESASELLAASEIEPAEFIDCWASGLRLVIQNPGLGTAALPEAAIAGRPWQVKLLFRPDLLGKRAMPPERQRPPS